MKIILSEELFGDLTRAEKKEHLRQVTSDPDDNIIVETAIAGSADYIISCDRHC